MSAQDLEQQAEAILREVCAGDPQVLAHLVGDMVPVSFALRAIVAALRQQPAPVNLEQVDRTDRELLTEFIRICREHKPVGQWPGERLCAAIERVMEREKPFRFIDEADMAPERGHNGRGGDADRPFGGPRRAAPHQPAPVVDDARMARALEWVRTAARGNVGEGDALRVALVESARKHLPAIEEAISAYDPNCGARTVRVVDDAMVELIEADKEYDAIRQRAQRYPCPGMDEHVMAVRKRRAAALARAQGVQS